MKIARTLASRKGLPKGAQVATGPTRRVPRWMLTRRAGKNVDISGSTLNVQRAYTSRTRGSITLA